MKKNVFNLSDDEILAMSELDLSNLNQKVLFVRDGMPSEWLSYAEELMDSAELLFANHESRLTIVMVQAQNADLEEASFHSQKQVSTISRTYFLLAGFAIENLFKGFIVYHDPSHLTSGQVSKTIKSHDLIRLAKCIDDITLSVEEENVCSTMSAAVPYWGRYPIPLNFNGILPDIGVTDETRTTIVGMFNRVSRQLYELIKDGWDSGIGAKSEVLRSKRYGDDIESSERIF